MARRSSAPRIVEVAHVPPEAARAARSTGVRADTREVTAVFAANDEVAGRHPGRPARRHRPSPGPVGGGL